MVRIGTISIGLNVTVEGELLGSQSIFPGIMELAAIAQKSSIQWRQFVVAVSGLEVLQ